MPDTQAFSPQFTITHQITRDLTAIERARGFLEAAALSEEWVREMSEQALLLEAHHTTHIEGTQLTLEQAREAWGGADVEQADDDDIRELLNYRQAFAMVTDHLEGDGPITESLIRAIHQRLVEGVRGGSAQPGQYRSVQNYVVSSRTQPVIYIPPPPEDVAPSMHELVEWLESGSTEIHPVLVAGIAQFQLVHIHPFVDGNGRTSRLLSTLCLYRSGYDFKRLFTLSEFYDRERAAFYRAIQDVRDTGMDLTGWLEYFTRGLATQLAEIKERGKRAIETEQAARTRGLGAGLGSRQAEILRLAASAGRVTIADLSQRFDVSRRTLQRDLEALVEGGHLLVVGSAATDPHRAYSVRTDPSAET